jgi:small subunit ribosomal protein S13
VPRIAGVDIPDKKKIRYSLRYIHGIGPQSADKILAEASIDGDVRAGELSDQDVGQIASIIEAGFIIEGTLRRQVQQHIQRLKDIRSYRGERHRKGLPVRGQRTRCNARTRKGRKKTVAGKKGVKGH